VDTQTDTHSGRRHCSAIIPTAWLQPAWLATNGVSMASTSHRLLLPGSACPTDRLTVDCRRDDYAVLTTLTITLISGWRHSRQPKLSTSVSGLL